MSNIQAKCYKTSSSSGKYYPCTAAKFSAYMGYVCLEQKLLGLQGEFLQNDLSQFFPIAQKTFMVFHSFLLCAATVA